MKKLNIKISIFTLLVFTFFFIDGVFKGTILKSVQAIIVVASSTLIYMILESINEIQALKNTTNIENMKKIEGKINDILLQEKNIVNVIIETSDKYAKESLNRTEQIDKIFNSYKDESDKKNNNVIKALNNCESGFIKRIETIEQTMNTKHDKINNLLNKYEEIMKDLGSKLINLNEESTKNVVSAMKNNTEMNKNYLESVKVLINKEEKISSYEQDIKDGFINVQNQILESIEHNKAVGTEISEHIKTMKAIIDDSLKKIKIKLDSYQSKMSDIVDDQLDDINNSFEDFRKEQKAAYSSQKDDIIENINKLGQVFSESIDPVIKQNIELLNYLEDMQKEWTSINKNEMEFLNKVWDENE